MAIELLKEEFYKTGCKAANGDKIYKFLKTVTYEFFHNHSQIIIKNANK